ALAGALAGDDKWLALGTLIARAVADSPFARAAVAEANAGVDPAEGDTFVDFVWCNTQLLAVRRTDFEALGGLQDPTGGWPNWDDVDFGYRAHLAGFQLRRVADAVGEHWDDSLSHLDKASQRWRRAGQSAAKLFAKYPDLPPYLPMFRDKLPLDWRRDGALLAGRKLARRLFSAGWVLRLLMWETAVLERIAPNSAWLPRFYRWVQGGYLALGYREGMDGV
ncbi:MAG: glycosyltransferase family 2 protein, partial [Anaerolineae bacterium]